MFTLFFIIGRLSVGGLLLGALLLLPLVLGMKHEDATSILADDGYLGVYGQGVLIVGVPGMLAAPFLTGIFLYIMVGGYNHDPRLRRSSKARKRRTAAEVGNSMVLFIGAAGMVSGVLCAMYAMLVAFWPDTLIGPRFPLTFPLSVGLFVGGLSIYAIGRFVR